MNDEHTGAEQEVFDRSKPVPKDWLLRRRLLRLGVPATMIGIGLAQAGRFIPNPFVNGV
jgi:hypothetical protein